jgi:hypothetical protein
MLSSGALFLLSLTAQPGIVEEKIAAGGECGIQVKNKY